MAAALPAVSGLSGVDDLHLVGHNTQEIAHVMDIQIVGDRAYASVAGSGGLQVYDLSDPAAPVRVASVGIPAWRSWARGDTLFLFGHQNGVQMFRIAAATPTLIFGYDPADAATAYEGGVRVGNKLYVAAHQRGIEVLAINPATGALTFDSTVNLANNACWNLAESGNRLYVANGRFGLSVVSLAGAPAEIATLALPGLASDVEVAGSVAYLALSVDGIASVDIANPAAPALLDRRFSYGNAFTMGLVGSRLAAGSDHYVELFDVSTPGFLQLAGWDDTPTWAMGADAGVTAGGDTLVAVSDWTGIAIYRPEPDPVPDIEVVPARVDFGTVGAARDTTVEVRNSGAAALNVTSITVPAGFSVAPGSFSVPPGGAVAVTVTASGAATARAILRYFCDDPDEPDVEQRVYKNNTTFPDVGSLAPDFTLTGTDGMSHTLSSLAGKVVVLQFGANW